jgi:GGDEF domain-containing protein
VHAGEEFAVLMPETAAGALQWCARLKDVVPRPGNKVTVSMGVSIRPEDTCRQAR